MKSAGYSGTPLPRKLGIKAGGKLTVLGAPRGFALDLPPGVVLGGRSKQDVILAFFEAEQHLAAAFGRLAGKLEPSGRLWIAWPKKASGKPTDLSENVVREIGLAAGLVDNKVCAIDDTWSGLQLVIRVKDRG